jgi:two-component system LytT family sensor kinase
MSVIGVRRILRAYALSIGLWLLLSVLTGIQYRILDEQWNIHSTLWEMLLLAGSRGLAYGLLTPPVFYLVAVIGRRALKPVQTIGVYLLALGPFMVMDACIRWTVLPPWDPSLEKYVPRAGHPPWEIIHEGFSDQITIYLAIVIAAYGYQYFENRRKQEVERAEFQRALAASELQSLKSQLHPHFLFNTLHGISTLIDTNRPAAKTMILRLSRLLRLVLDHDSLDLVPLRDEVRFVREYLDLERMRLDARLTVDWLIDRRVESVLVPQLILQPLIENALRYGVACFREGGWIKLSAHLTDAKLEICVSNSSGGDRTSGNGTGIGLRNTTARIKYLYSDEATFTFTDTNGIATATIILPALHEHAQPQGTGSKAAVTPQEITDACTDRR